MGTRALTIFMDEGKELVVMYKQFDGYPDGLGVELAEFLKDFIMVNGIGVNDTGKKIANGMGCLAAQVIAHWKEGAGGVYLYPAGTRDVWEEFEYIITGEEGEMPELEIRHAENNLCLYKGSAEKVYYQITGKEAPTFEENLKEKLLDYHNDLPDVIIQMAHDKKNYKRDPVAGTIAAEFFRKYFPEDSDYYRVINGICKHHPL